MKGTHNEQPGRFMSIREYAKSRGVSDRTLYKLIEQRDSSFPHLRFGSRIVIDAERADAWAARATTQRSEGENG